MVKGVCSLALVAAIALAGPAAAHADSLTPYTRVVLSTGGHAVEWTANGGYCLRTDMLDVCADVVYDPRPPIAFRIVPRGTVLVCAAVPVKRVYLYVARDGRQGPRSLGSPRSRPVDRDRRCWTTTLPRRVHGARWLHIYVDYGERGGATFLPGVRTAPR